MKSFLHRWCWGKGYHTEAKHSMTEKRWEIPNPFLRKDGTAVESPKEWEKRLFSESAPSHWGGFAVLSTASRAFLIFRTAEPLQKESTPIGLLPDCKGFVFDVCPSPFTGSNLECLFKTQRKLLTGAVSKNLRNLRDRHIMLIQEDFGFFHFLRFNIGGWTLTSL